MTMSADIPPNRTQSFIEGKSMLPVELHGVFEQLMADYKVAALKHHPEIQLKAGMPAELFVTTSHRTLFEYLVSPITAFTNRALRET